MSLQSWFRQRKIAFIGGNVKRDPVVTLASSLEKAQAGKIKNVMVSIQWEDGSMSIDYSNMRRSDVVAHAFNAQCEAHDAVRKSNYE